MRFEDILFSVHVAKWFILKGCKSLLKKSKYMCYKSSDSKSRDSWTLKPKRKWKSPGHNREKINCK